MEINLEAIEVKVSGAGRIIKKKDFKKEESEQMEEPKDQVG